jgi:hypothetical protein
MLIQNQVGPIATTTSISAGLQAPARAGQLGDTIVSELHGRFYEQAYRGNFFSYGLTPTALSATTTQATTSATATPILGLWNPLSSTVNLVITQAALQVYINTYTTPVSSGALVWMYSTGNGAISTGNTPINRRTLTASGSQAKAFAVATALTGLTNVLAFLEGADFTNSGILTYGTIVAPTAGTSVTSFGGVQNFDGSLIVPPGGVLALMNAVSTTTMSAAGRIMWEEVPT